MNLFDPKFIVFFIIILVTYYIIDIRAQKWVFFIASSIFVSLFSPYFLCYAYLFLIFNYFTGILIDAKSNSKRIKKIIFNIAIVLNISSLVFFKYINFVIDNINETLNLFNYNVSLAHYKLLIPLGISYFTFQGIGYLIQIYNRIEKPERNIIIFANYIILFPKFLAGPIEQSKSLIPQLKKTYLFNNKDVVDGFKLILWGAFKKIVIADRISIIISTVYSNVDSFSGQALLITFLIQPIQIYFDFSGYTDIALGVARSFGIKLTNNFNRPLFSPNVSTFWRRWHISLSTWCNDFIFKRIILKRRKWGLGASAYAVFISFLVIGIWHGARWNFIILGLLQGIAINYEFFTKRKRLYYAGKLPKRFVLIASCLLTYLFFCLSLVFFNSVSVKDAIHFMMNMFQSGSISDIGVQVKDSIIILIGLSFVMFVEFQQEYGKDWFIEIDRWNKWKRIIFYWLLAFVIICFGGAARDFVYMQF